MTDGGEGAGADHDDNKSDGSDRAESGCALAECLEHLTANAVVVTVLGLIPASSDTVESELEFLKSLWGLGTEEE